MIRLSSTRTRRSRLPAEYRSCGIAAGAGDAGSSPLTDCKFKPGIASAPMSSKESIYFLLVLVSERFHWQDSHEGSSILQNLTSGSADVRPVGADAPPSAGTAFNCPVFTVDFSAWVAPIARR